MKNLILTLLLISSCAAASAQGVLLGPGESYTIEFSSLFYLRPALPAENYVGGLAVDFPNNGFIGGETVKVDRFRDTLSETPISSGFSLPGPGDPNSSTALLWNWPNDQPFWTDMQGVVCVTGITGNFCFQGVIVNELINGGVYGAYISVPEPSASLLLALGVSCLIARKLHRAPSHQS